MSDGGEALARVLESLGEELAQRLGKGVEMACLVVVEAHGEDEFLDLRNREALEIYGREDRACGGGEETAHSACRAGVFCAGGEDCAHEDAERIVRLRLDEFDHGGVVGGELSFEKAVYGGNVLDGHWKPLEFV